MTNPLERDAGPVVEPSEFGGDAGVAQPVAKAGVTKEHTSAFWVDPMDANSAPDPDRIAKEGERGYAHP